MPPSTPNAVPEPDPIIMTALFDAQSFDRFDGLRHRHFPPALNRVPAHVTLFHHLPGADLRRIVERVRQGCDGTPPLSFACRATRFLGRGVALEVDCAGLVALRAAFAAEWRDGLTAQDRQGYRPHVTVQNKASGEEAREVRDALDAILPITGRFVGVALWHYRGGPWEEAGRFAFAAEA